jgi:hypothetical protein
MRVDARWVRIALTVLLLIAFGACLVHSDDEADDHGLNPHACAAVLLGAPMIGLTEPQAGSRIRIEALPSPGQAPLRSLDPPPEVPPLG